MIRVIVPCRADAAATNRKRLDQDVEKEMIVVNDGSTYDAKRD